MKTNLRLLALNGGEKSINVGFSKSIDPDEIEGLMNS